MDDVFRALADPTRRRVVEALSQRPASVSELAQPFKMALPSFLEHLKVLHDRRQADRERPGEVADRRRREAQPGEHAAAGRIGERLKGEVEAMRFVKHALN